MEGDGSGSRGEGGDPNGRANGLLWYKDLGRHVDGEFSMAVIQANNLLEDQSQLESGPLSLLDSGPCGTFVGVYDGHGGPETSRFVNQSLFTNLKSMFLKKTSWFVCIINSSINELYWSIVFNSRNSDTQE